MKLYDKLELWGHKLICLSTYLQIKEAFKDDSNTRIMSFYKDAGKTTALMKLSAKYKVPVLESSMLISQLRKEYPKAIIVGANPDWYKGKYYDTILIDDCFLTSKDMNMIESMCKKYIRVYNCL